MAMITLDDAKLAVKTATTIEEIMSILLSIDPTVSGATVNSTSLLQFLGSSWGQVLPFSWGLAVGVRSCLLPDSPLRSLSLRAGASLRGQVLRLNPVTRPAG